MASCNTYLPVVSASINIPNFTKAQADKSQSINEKIDNECKTTLITRHTKLNMFYKLRLSFNHHIQHTWAVLNQQPVKKAAAQPEDVLSFLLLLQFAAETEISCEFELHVFDRPPPVSQCSRNR